MDQIRKLSSSSKAKSRLSNLANASAITVNSSRAQSVVSNLSIESDKNYHDTAKQIAIEIFDEYLRDGSPYELDTDEKIKHNLYEKYGCIKLERKESQVNGDKASFEYDTD